MAKFCLDVTKANVSACPPGHMPLTPSALCVASLNPRPAQMEEVYDASGYMWDDDDKREELMEHGGAARFLVVREVCAEEGKGRPVGFVHFRFSLQGEAVGCLGGQPCLYIMDIQIEKQAQRKGLGRHLVRSLEMIARKQRMMHVMLPVTVADDGQNASLPAALIRPPPLPPPPLSRAPAKASPIFSTANTRGHVSVCDSEQANNKAPKHCDKQQSPLPTPIPNPSLFPRPSGAKAFFLEGMKGFALDDLSSVVSRDRQDAAKLRTPSLHPFIPSSPHPLISPSLINLDAPLLSSLPPFASDPPFASVLPTHALLLPAPSPLFPLVPSRQSTKTAPSLSSRSPSTPPSPMPRPAPKSSPPLPRTATSPPQTPQPRTTP